MVNHRHDYRDVGPGFIGFIWQRDNWDKYYPNCFTYVCSVGCEQLLKQELNMTVSLLVCLW